MNKTLTKTMMALASRLEFLAEEINMGPLMLTAAPVSFPAAIETDMIREGRLRSELCE